MGSAEWEVKYGKRLMGSDECELKKRKWEVRNNIGK